MLPGVFADFAAAGRLRAEHLLSRGLRRFAALTHETDRAQQAELKEFASALAEAGYACAAVKTPLDALLSLGAWRKTERTIAAWMNAWQPPIGVYVGGEMEGRMVAQMCRNLGRRVPQDVAIITGWNEETFCEHLRPTLSSVELGFERIGYESARLLDGLMDGKPAPAEPVCLPPQGLIVRESTDFFAVDDPLIAAALEFIAANYHQPIGPEDVARAVSTGRRTLARHFRKYLDRPIATEIRRARIERAKRELRRPSGPSRKYPATPASARRCGCTRSSCARWGSHPARTAASGIRSGRPKGTTGAETVLVWNCIKAALSTCHADLGGASPRRISRPLDYGGPGTPPRARKCTDISSG